MPDEVREHLTRDLSRMNEETKEITDFNEQDSQEHTCRAGCRQFSTRQETQGRTHYKY